MQTVEAVGSGKRRQVDALTLVRVISILVIRIFACGQPGCSACRQAAQRASLLLTIDPSTIMSRRIRSKAICPLRPGRKCRAACSASVCAMSSHGSWLAATMELALNIDAQARSRWSPMKEQRIRDKDRTASMRLEPVRVNGLGYPVLLGRKPQRLDRLRSGVCR